MKEYIIKFYGNYKDKDKKKNYKEGDILILHDLKEVFGLIEEAVYQKSKFVVSEAQIICDLS